MGVPKQKQQRPSSKRKNPFSSVPKKSNVKVNKATEFKPKKKEKEKKEKKRDAATAEVVKQNNGGNGKGQEGKVEKFDLIHQPTAAQQLSYFLQQYQSANGVQLSSLEVDSLKDASMLDLGQGTAESTSSLVDHMKIAFGSSWREMLCARQLKEGKSNPGNPVVLVVASSAMRSLELLRELRPLTKDCPAVKLFSKHMKIDEQVSLLKHHVNIACGTPSRIKKLIDMEALGLSRLELIVLDMCRDVKGYSLLTLSQVRDEFWDLYKRCFHQKLLEGRLCICLYGSIPDLPAVEASGD